MHAFAELADQRPARLERLPYAGSANMGRPVVAALLLALIADAARELVDTQHPVAGEEPDPKKERRREPNPPGRPHSHRQRLHEEPTTVRRDAALKTAQGGPRRK